MTAVAGSSLADGLFQLLQPVVVECDEKVGAVRNSQVALAAQIDALAAKLQQISENADFPGLSGASKKLAISKKRLANVGMALGTIQARVDRMYKTAGVVKQGMAPQSTQGVNDTEKKEPSTNGGEPVAPTTTAGSAGKPGEAEAATDSTPTADPDSQIF